MAVTTQTIIGGGASYVALGSTRYSPLSGAGGIETSAWQLNQTYVKQVISTPGTLSNFSIELNGAPGNGGSYVFTVIINDVASDLVVTVTDTNTSGSDEVHSEAVSAGDVVYIKCVPTNNPTNNCGVQYSTQFVGDNDNESLILGHAYPYNTGGNSFTPLTGGHHWNYGGSGYEPNMNHPMPTATVITNLFVQVKVAPGGSATWTYTLRKNKVNTALTCTITGAETTCNDTSNPITFAAGDLADILIAPADSPSQQEIYLGLTAKPTTANEFLLGGVGGGMSNVDTQYNYLLPTFTGYLTPSAWSTTEANRQQLTSIAFTAKKLYIRLSESPGTSKSYTFTLMKNGVATDLTVTANSTNWTSVGDTTTVSVVAGDNLSLRQAPTNSPTSVRAFWGLVGVVEAAGTSDTATIDSAQVLTLTQPAPTIKFDFKTSPSAQALTLAQPAPTFNFDYQVDVSAQTLTLTQPIPSIEFGGDNTKNTEVQPLTLAQPTPTIIRTETASVSSQSLTLSQPTPTISNEINETVSPSARTLTLTLNSPTVTIGGATGDSNTYLMAQTDGNGADTLYKYVDGVLVETNTLDTRTIYNSKAIISTTNDGDDTNYTLSRALTSNVYFVIMNNMIYTTNDTAFPYSITGLTLTFDSALPSDLADTQIFIVCV